MSTPDYPIGFGKPPVASRFKPGQSGNPKGRRKGSRNLATDVSRELAEILTVTEGGRQRRITKQQAVIKALVARCIKGDVRAAIAVLRLVPEVEREQKAAESTQSVTPIDVDILEAFRDQIFSEIGSTNTAKEPSP